MTSGRTIGVFTMQSGPGTENSFGGVAQAYADSVPVLIQAAGHERHLISVPPNFNALVNYRDITKWIEQVNLPTQIAERDDAARSPRSATAGRGRCMVEIPWDVYEEEIPEPDRIRAGGPRANSAPDPAGVREPRRRCSPTPSGP